MFKLMIERRAELEKRIAELDREITRRTKEDADARRLMTGPGVGRDCGDGDPRTRTAD